MPIGYPNSDVLNTSGWADQAGGGFAIYTSIDEAAVSFADYIKVVSLPIGGAPDLPYTTGLSAPSALVTGESYLMLCYADAAYASGGARHIRWELLEGATVLETVIINATPTGGSQFSNIVSATVGDRTNLRYRWTLLDDGTSWQANVYQAEIRVIFPHLDIPSATASRRVVVPFSGSALNLGAASPVPVLAAGVEAPATLVVDGPVPRVHG